MNTLQYIFSNIWTFIGTLILISVIVDGIVEIIKSFKK